MAIYLHFFQQASKNKQLDKRHKAGIVQDAFEIAPILKNKTNYNIYKTQSKVKLQDESCENSEEFQDGNKKALNRVWGPYEHGLLCNFTGLMPMKQIPII